MTYNDIVNRICEDMEKVLDNNYISYSVAWPGAEQEEQLVVIGLEIRGDWKHDHLRSQYLVEKMGGIHCGERVIESDGGDWYSSVHTYVFWKSDYERENGIEEE